MNAHALTSLAILLILSAGCAEPPAAVPTVNPLAPIDCPESGRVQAATMLVDGHNLTYADGRSYASTYIDFPWQWNAKNQIELEVKAEWQAATLDEKVMQLRLEDASGRGTIGGLRGQSPLIVNVTFDLPTGAQALRVFMEPSPDPSLPVGYATNIQPLETHITVHQTRLCSERA